MGQISLRWKVSSCRWANPIRPASKDMSSEALIGVARGVSRFKTLPSVELARRLHLVLSIATSEWGKNDHSIKGISFLASISSKELSKNIYDDSGFVSLSESEKSNREKPAPKVLSSSAPKWGRRSRSPSGRVETDRSLEVRRTPPFAKNLLSITCDVKPHIIYI